MTLTIEVTPEQAERVAYAKSQGVDVDALIRVQIETLPVPEQKAGSKTEELFAKWAAEDASDDPEEIAAAERELAEFKANMNANRAATGERLLYR